jgi:hypothetical protein
MVLIDTVNETVKVSVSIRTVHVEYHANLCLPGFRAMGCKPISKSIHLLDSPFIFKRIDVESIVSKLPEESVEELNVMPP